jgi:DNA-binding Lrp family transcriptional regulator
VKSLATAFVVVQTESGYEAEVLKNMKSFKELREAYQVFGAYDILASIETNTMEQLKEVISWKIRRLDKIRSTLTLIVM